VPCLGTFATPQKLGHCKVREMTSRVGVREGHPNVHFYSTVLLLQTQPLFQDKTLDSLFLPFDLLIYHFFYL
jgi:hypothetical protein